MHGQERDYRQCHQLHACLEQTHLIHVSAKPHNMTIIQVYAPTTDHDDKEVKKFYELLESTILEVPKKDIIIVQGDWNAK